MEKFIGVVEVRSAAGWDILGGADGAFVNVLCLAASPERFRERVIECMREHHLEVLNFADVGLVEDRVSAKQLVPELEALANVLTDEFPIQFDEFQAYEER
jgi:hypothetical protein